MENEIWAPIAGFEGKYVVSNMGRIKSLQRVVVVGRGYEKLIPEKIIFSCPNRKNRGYLKVVLSDNGKPVTFLVHRLVAQYFVPNPDNKPAINHKDGNKINNHSSNLEWCTYLENSKHASELNLLGRKKGYATNFKLSTEAVIGIKKMLKQGIKQRDIAALFSATEATVSSIKTGRIWSNIEV